MSDLPEPIVPGNCDLRGFPYTPLFRARLFGSSFHARATDAEWRAGVTLWLKSWDQVPAGTLPDDDIDLCRLAELGRNIKAWLRLRTGAMRGWIKCSDGRMHHAVVAEGVLEAWAKHKTAKLKGKAGAAKRWGSSIAEPSPGDSTSNAPAMARAMPGDSNRIEGNRKEESKQAAEPALLKLPASPFPETAAIEYEAKTGRATVAGYYLDRTQERVFEAARIDDTKWMGNIKPLIEWLAAGIEPDTIVGAISRRVEQGKYAVPHSLNYFDKPVREAHGRAGP